MPDEKRENIYLNVPSKYAKGKESIDMWDFPDEKNHKQKLATVTLPKGTELPDGTDVSYFKFVVHQGQVDPAGQKYPNVHSIRFPKENSDGEPWNISLSKQDRVKDGDDWIDGDKHEAKCTSVELQAALKEQYTKYKEYKEQQKGVDKAQDSDKSKPSLSEESKDAKRASKDLGTSEQVKESAAR